MCDLPIDVLVGGELLEPHQCRLSYLPNGRKKVELLSDNCSRCSRNLEFLQGSNDPQLDMVPKTPYRNRLRFRNFPMLPVLEDLDDPKNLQAGLVAGKTNL